VAEQYDLNVTNNNTLRLNIPELLNDTDDAILESPFPLINLTDIFSTDLDEIDALNRPIITDEESLLNGNSIRDLIEGNITFSLKELMEAWNDANLTDVDLPIGEMVAEVLTLDTFPRAFAHNYTVFKSFASPNGKFGNTLGNVAVIDCKYMNLLFRTSYLRFFNELVEMQPLYYVFLSTLHKDVKALIKNLDFCNYAQTVEGVVQDQVTMYTGSKKNMVSLIGAHGNRIMDELTLDANVTIGTPLKDQLNSSEMIAVFFNSMMSTIIIFLALLCTQLIYSLMLSDVEEKTFEFGMLRALGFNTKNIMITISF
jgi:hypothetical protein